MELELNTQQANTKIEELDDFPIEGEEEDDLFEETPKADDKNKGIIYLSRIPQGLTPTSLRTILSVYGELGRVYIALEKEERRKKRKQMGGHGKRRFVEGWVEFLV